MALPQLPPTETRAYDQGLLTIGIPLVSLNEAVLNPWIIFEGGSFDEGSSEGHESLGLLTTSKAWHASTILKRLVVGVLRTDPHLRPRNWGMTGRLGQTANRPEFDTNINLLNNIFA